MHRSIIVSAALFGAFLIPALVAPAALMPAEASAQDMNLALSRYRIAAEDPAVNPSTPCTTDGGSRAWCADNDAWTRAMTQFGGSMLPPVLTPAGTRGVRGIYVGFESWITGIENDPSTATGDAWFRGVEGDGMMAGTPGRSRFVDSVLAWGRFNVRKGLPFGFELGTSVGYLANTGYWTLGLEVRWALFEGFRDDVGWVPDFAVRGAVQTLIGDGEFNITVPSVDLILSEPFIVANSVEIIPSITGQFAWIFADSELVDLDPGVSTFDTCNPDPSLRDPEVPTPERPPYCRSDGMQLNHNVVFPSLRSFRARLGAGLQIRYEWFTLLGAFQFDVLPPGETDSAVPIDMPRQWTASVGAGLSL
ncbi:MAG: hypothetical protein AB8I08_09660 [Sandaracinaceae bacterium]